MTSYYANIRKYLYQSIFFLVWQATCNTRLLRIPTQMSKILAGKSPAGSWAQCEMQTLQLCSLLAGSGGLSRDHTCSNICVPVAGAVTCSDTASKGCTPHTAPQDDSESRCAHPHTRSQAHPSLLTGLFLCTLICTISSPELWCRTEDFTTLLIFATQWNK